MAGIFLGCVCFHEVSAKFNIMMDLWLLLMNTQPEFLKFKELFQQNFIWEKNPLVFVFTLHQNEIISKACGKYIIHIISIY